MPPTPRGNSWILVLTDHFTRRADALAITDTSAPMVARVLDQHVFCYFGLPEQIHSNQGPQFQSQLMSDLCRLWGVNQSRTTPYHPQGNRVMERNNQMLSDALWSLLLRCSQEEWDTVLPQVMQPIIVHHTPVLVRPPNLLMLGRETRVPHHLTYHIPEQDHSVHEYASELVERMKAAHKCCEISSGRCEERTPRNHSSTKLETVCGWSTTIGVTNRRLSYSLSLWDPTQ